MSLGRLYTGVGQHLHRTLVHVVRLLLGTLVGSYHGKNGGLLGLVGRISLNLVRILGPPPLGPFHQSLQILLLRTSHLIHILLDSGDEVVLLSLLLCFVPVKAHIMHLVKRLLLHLTLVSSGHRGLNLIIAVRPLHGVISAHFTSSCTDLPPVLDLSEVISHG